MLPAVQRGRICKGEPGAFDISARVLSMPNSSNTALFLILAAVQCNAQLFSARCIHRFPSDLPHDGRFRKCRNRGESLVFIEEDKERGTILLRRISWSGVLGARTFCSVSMPNSLHFLASNQM